MALAFILPAPMSTDWLAFGIPLAAVGGIALFLWRGLDRGAIALGLVLGIAAFVGLVVLNYYNAVSA
jgi:hypothetical protein